MSVLRKNLLFLAASTTIWAAAMHPATRLRKAVALAVMATRVYFGGVRTGVFPYGNSIRVWLSLGATFTDPITDGSR